MTIGIEKDVSCNFCDKSKMISSPGGYQLIYPYKFVYTIQREKNPGLKATICEDCIKELFTKTITQKS
jgi:hypothetical protein